MKWNKTKAEITAHDLSLNLSLTHSDKWDHKHQEVP